MGGYQPLCTFTFRHEATVSLCHRFKLTPAPRTRTAMATYGLLARFRWDGLDIAYEPSQLELLVQDVAGKDRPEALLFRVFADDPLFFNYTGTDLISESQVLYLRNERTEPDHDGQTRITSAETVTEADLVDSKTLPAGVIGKYDFWRKLVCVLGIDLSRLDLAGQADGPPFTRYYATFNARRTYWKYLLLDDLAGQDVYIADLDEQVEFEPLGETEVSTRHRASAYRSKVPLPLTRTPPFRFQLRERNGENSRVLIRRLPVASAEYLSRDRLNDEHSISVSEIFVNS